MKKTLIFDLDGTILNTTEIGFKMVNEAIIKAGLSPISISGLKEQWGLPFNKLMDWAFNYVGANDEQIIKITEYEKEFKDYYLDHGIMSALHNLRLKNNLIALVTSRTRKSLEEIANLVRLDCEIFQFIQTAENGECHKPDPHVFDPVIEWSISNGQDNLEDMIYFGDTITYDFAAVKHRPPMDFVGIVSGVNTKEEFLSAGLKKHQVVNFYDLPVYLRKYGN